MNPITNHQAFLSATQRVVSRVGAVACISIALLGMCIGCEHAAEPGEAENSPEASAETPATTEEAAAGNEPKLISRADASDIRDSEGNRPQRPTGDPMMIIDHGDVDQLLGFLYWERDPDWQDESGLSLLARAVTIGRIDMAETLIRYGADVNARVRINNTALHWAVRADQLEAAELLLANGVDPNIAGGPDHDRTALGLARRYGYQEMVELLIRYGATP